MHPILPLSPAKVGNPVALRIAIHAASILLRALSPVTLAACCVATLLAISTTAAQAVTTQTDAGEHNRIQITVLNCPLENVDPMGGRSIAATVVWPEDDSISTTRTPYILREVLTQLKAVDSKRLESDIWCYYARHTCTTALMAQGWLPKNVADQEIGLNDLEAFAKSKKSVMLDSTGRLMFYHRAIAFVPRQATDTLCIVIDSSCNTLQGTAYAPVLDKVTSCVALCTQRKAMIETDLMANLYPLPAPKPTAKLCDFFSSWQGMLGAAAVALTVWLINRVHRRHSNANYIQKLEAAGGESEEEFLRSCGASSERQRYMALKVRAIIAKFCGTPQRLICHDARFINDLQLDNDPLGSLWVRSPKSKTFQNDEATGGESQEEF